MSNAGITRMMSVIQESVKLAFCMQIPGLCRSQGRFSNTFCDKRPSWRPSCPHSYFIWLQASVIS